MNDYYANTGISVRSFHRVRRFTLPPRLPAAPFYVREWWFIYLARWSGLESSQWNRIQLHQSVDQIDFSVSSSTNNHDNPGTSERIPSSKRKISLFVSCPKCDDDENDFDRIVIEFGIVADGKELWMFSPSSILKENSFDPCQDFKIHRNSINHAWLVRTESLAISKIRQTKNLMSSTPIRWYVVGRMFDNVAPRAFKMVAS